MGRRYLDSGFLQLLHDWKISTGFQSGKSDFKPIIILHLSPHENPRSVGVRKTESLGFARERKPWDLMRKKMP